MLLFYNYSGQYLIYNYSTNGGRSLRQVTIFLPARKCGAFASYDPVAHASLDPVDVELRRRSAPLRYLAGRRAVPARYLIRSRRGHSVTIVRNCKHHAQQDGSSNTTRVRSAAYSSVTNSLAETIDNCQRTTLWDGMQLSPLQGGRHARRIAVESVLVTRVIAYLDANGLLERGRVAMSPDPSAS
jgi:hypothetical protein